MKFSIFFISHLAHIQIQSFPECQIKFIFPLKASLKQWHKNVHFEQIFPKVSSAFLQQIKFYNPEITIKYDGKICKKMQLRENVQSLQLLFLSLEEKFVNEWEISHKSTSFQMRWEFNSLSWEATMNGIKWHSNSYSIILFSQTFVAISSKKKIQSQQEINFHHLKL
jgi:hypothetical protein